MERRENFEKSISKRFEGVGEGGERENFFTVFGKTLGNFVMTWKKFFQETEPQAREREKILLTQANFKSESMTGFFILLAFKVRDQTQCNANLFHLLSFIAGFIFSPRK